jgi:hypothetical protein
MQRRDVLIRNPTLASMIRKNLKYKVKTPNQLLGEILHQELVERDVAKSLGHKVNKNASLNASPNDKVESSHGSKVKEGRFK